MTYPECDPCHRPMRPRGENAIDHPGTVALANTHLCKTCEARQARDRAKPAEPEPVEQVDVFDWQRHRLCIPNDPTDRAAWAVIDAAFFTESSSNGTPSKYPKAAAICAVCPVRELGCRPSVMDAEQGLTRNERRGYAAGLTPAQRVQLDPDARGIRTRGPGSAPKAVLKPLKPIEHGTALGYGMHIARKQAACEECRAAHAVKAAGDRERAKARRAAAEVAA